MRTFPKLAFLALVLCTCAKKEDAVPPQASAQAAASSSPAVSAAPTPPSSTSAPALASDTLATQKGVAKITPLHHATMLIQIGDLSIYTDPVHDVSYDALPKADMVLITDIHPDHLDLPGLDKVRQPLTAVVAPPAVAEKLPKELPNVIVLKNGESQQVKGFKVEAVPMYNLKRGPKPGQLYHDKGRGDGYVLNLWDKRIYVSGDTECIPEMKALKDIDVAFVCMNLPYTMTPGEAAECINAFRPKVVYPYHYRDSDLGELKKDVTAPGVEVRLRDWYAH